MTEELEKPIQVKKESIAAQFARYVSLNVFGMIGVSCNILVDTFFIANGVGAEGLAGLNFALVIAALFVGIAQGMQPLRVGAMHWGITVFYRSSS